MSAATKAERLNARVSSSHSGLFPDDVIEVELSPGEWERATVDPTSSRIVASSPSFVLLLFDDTSHATVPISDFKDGGRIRWRRVT